jgi:hypothetical protein
MAGYRESSYDPNAYERQGAPLRPFNWVQWTGVALGLLGALGYLAYAADRLGWIDIGIDSAAPFIALPLIGVTLINSRRQPGTQVGEEQLARNRKILLITVAALFAIGAALLVIEFTGAK